MDSFLLEEKDRESCTVALCDDSYYTLFKKKEFYCISNVPKYRKIISREYIIQKTVRSKYKKCHFSFHSQ